MEALRLTAAQKRQVRKLDVHVERMSDSDKAWFALRPDRDHRLRRAHPCEIAQFEVVGNKVFPALPAGHAWFVLVHQVIPGARIRHPLAYFATAPIDDVVPEEAAAGLYGDCFETPASRAIDVRAREAVRG